MQGGKVDREEPIRRIFMSNYSGLPLNTGAKKRAVTVMAALLQPKQRVRSESAAGTGTDSVAAIARRRALRRSEAADLSSYLHEGILCCGYRERLPFDLT